MLSIQFIDFHFLPCNFELDMNCYGRCKNSPNKFRFFFDFKEILTLNLGSFYKENCDFSELIMSWSK